MQITLFYYITLQSEAKLTEPKVRRLPIEHKMNMLHINKRLGFRKHCRTNFAGARRPRYGPFRHSRRLPHYHACPFLMSISMTWHLYPQPTFSLTKIIMIAITMFLYTLTAVAAGNNAQHAATTATRFLSLASLYLRTSAFYFNEIL